jgi:ribosomal protein L40E
VSLIFEKLAEIGLLRPDWAGVFLLGSVMLLFIVIAVYVASRIKGRSALVWVAISSTAQFAAIIVPLTIAALTGILDPSELGAGGPSLNFTTFRLFAEMSVVAGVSTLGVLSFLTQTRWKTCPACSAHVPWRAKTCPACATSLTVGGKTNSRRAAGDQPRLTARTIHLPLELDKKLKRLAMPKGSRRKTTENAAVSQYIRQLLQQFDAEARRAEKD